MRAYKCESTGLCPSSAQYDSSDTDLRFEAEILMIDGTWRRIVYVRLCSVGDDVAFTTDDGVVVLRKAMMEGLRIHLHEPEKWQLSSQ